MADASWIEATDTQKLAKAKLKSAERAAEEHIIRAPFAGQILEEFKHEGESVRANEPVVRLGNLDTVRVWAYIPLEYAYPSHPGHADHDPAAPATGATIKHPIEQAVPGVIASVDQSIQVGEKTVKIYADLDNAEHELQAGPGGDHDDLPQARRASVLRLAVGREIGLHDPPERRGEAPASPGPLPPRQGAPLARPESDLLEAWLAGWRCLHPVPLNRQG